MSSTVSYEALADGESLTTDLLIASSGYEGRARHVSESGKAGAKRVIAYTYSHNHVHDFATNVQHFESVGEVRHPDSTADFRELLVEDVRSVRESTEHLRVAIDISSFCRERIAVIVSVLAELGSEAKLEATFLYSLATFDSHPPAVPATVMINAPLHGFEGWTADPSRPVACLLGLGFENQVALAALETLEPLHTFAFVANNADTRFNDRVREDNGILIRSDEVTVLSYELNAPFDTLHMVEGLVHALRKSHRLAFIPLGPKPFALLSLLIAQSYDGEMAVWRVSSDDDDPQDREASGPIAGIHASFGPVH